MRIAVVAPLEEPVPPRTYGGTELVVFNLVEELVSGGHGVTLFAPGNSRTSARLEPVFDTNLRAHPDGANAARRDVLKFSGLGRAIEKLADQGYDIIHNHIGWRIMPFASLLRAPMITTLHGNLRDERLAYTFRQFPTSPYVSISDSQREPMPDLNYVATVYNGIDCATFDYRDSPDDYFAFLGRFSPEKGAVEAIEAARAAGVRLRMAAKIDVADREYYELAVKPLIDGKQIEYIGEVDHAGKNELLKKARGLLMPINWDEPFGLVMIEALVCGCPVIANRRGSVPEIVNDEVGFITESHDEIVAAIHRIDEINRARCRDYACERFERAAMAKGYVRAYEKVIAEEPAELTLR